MNFSLSSKQYFYFQKKGFILFEEYLSDSVHQEMLSQTTLQSKRNILWIKESYKKFALKKSLASFVASLSNTSLLRFGFDHLFTSQQDLTNLFRLEIPLSKLCSYQNLNTAVFFNLSSQPVTFTAIEIYYKEPKEEGEEKEMVRNEIPIELLPKAAFFFHPHKIRFSFENTQSPLLYLTTYTNPNSRYILCENDPFTHEIKKEGCVFGDLLKDEYHPLFACKTSL